MMATMTTGHQNIYRLKVRSGAVMEVQNSSSGSSKEGEEVELRRGPWMVEEDVALIDYIEKHGEGQWNSLARRSGLKRTGKSCRLRWLNYLRPGVRRGNITPEEQLLILELHSRYGNRWSKIAQYLPGRTDNEIKNHWRTRVQKHAKQLQCDVNSAKFKDVMRCLWMPQLMERIRVASGICPSLSASVTNLPVCPNGQLGQAGMNPESSNANSAVTTLQVWSPAVQNPDGYCNQGLLDLEYWDMGGNLWNVEDNWF